MVSATCDSSLMLGLRFNSLDKAFISFYYTVWKRQTMNLTLLKKGFVVPSTMAAISIFLRVVDKPSVFNTYLHSLFIAVFKLVCGCGYIWKSLFRKIKQYIIWNRLDQTCVIIFILMKHSKVQHNLE